MASFFGAALRHSAVEKRTAIGGTSGCSTVPRVDLILDAASPHGLPAGPNGDAREMDYFTAFWRHPYDVAPGCRVYVPAVSGYGAVTVALYPNGTNGLRVARTLEPIDPNRGLSAPLTLGTACSAQTQGH